MTSPKETQIRGIGMRLAVHDNAFHNPNYEETGVAATQIETHRTGATHVGDQPPADHGNAKHTPDFLPDNARIPLSCAPDGAAALVLTGNGLGSNPSYQVAGGALTSGFRARLSSSQIIPSGVYTRLQLSTEKWDIGNEWNITTHRFTANAIGKYLFVGVVQITGLLDGNSLIGTFKKNGAYAGSHVVHPIGAGGNPSVMCSTLLSLVANDYIELFIWQNSGVDRSASRMEYRNYLSGAKIG